MITTVMGMITINPLQNPNCDKNKCINPNGEVRLLPYGGGANMIVCYDCYLHEVGFWRTQRKVNLWPEAEEIPEWEDLKVYEGSH